MKSTGENICVDEMRKLVKIKSLKVEVFFRMLKRNAEERKENYLNIQRHWYKENRFFYSKPLYNKIDE